MHRIPGLAALALAPLFYALSSPAAAGTSACTAIESLPAVITSPGVYCLQRNLSTPMTSGYAISIEAEDVTLDCGGWLLNGSGGGTDTQAIGIHAEQSYATIRGCSVRGFMIGIETYFGDGGEFESHYLVEDNRIDGSTWVGILGSGANTVIRRNVVVDTGGYWDEGGQAIAGGWQNEIVDNVIDGVYGTGDGDEYDTATAIFSRRGGVIARNRVRNLGAPQNYGLTFRESDEPYIYPTVVHDNLVVAGGSGDSGVYYCLGEMTLVRGDAATDGSGAGCGYAEAVPGTASAPTPVPVASSCKVIGALPAVISVRGVYCLAEGLSTAISSGVAITIAADNVTLDCRDHLLDGTAGGAASTAVGIGAVQRSGVTIRGCAVRGFRDGIRLVEQAGAAVPPRGIVVEGNRVHNVARNGIVVNADGGIVRGNMVARIGSYGAEGASNGIQSKFSVDVVDNRVVAVRGLAATGIYAAWNHGGMIGGNRVSELERSPAMVGIRVAANSHRTTVAGNAVLQTVDPTEQNQAFAAISCGSDGNQMRGNTAMGYADAFQDCADAGGNVSLIGFEPEEP